jgi:hypothetical protein
MALPIISTPTFYTTIPSNPGTTVKFRPFLVSEEKILLMAQETNDPKAMMQAMKDIVTACTYGAVNPNTLTMFDLEFLFLQLRQKSVGETATVLVKCEHCEADNEIEIKLDQIELNLTNLPEKRIMLTDTIGVVLKFMDVNAMTSLASFVQTANPAETLTEVIITSIESIFDSESTWPSSESTRAELTTFINSLNRAQMAKIENFINLAPKLECKIDSMCSKCQKPIQRTLSGIQSFFV